MPRFVLKSLLASAVVLASGAPMVARSGAHAVIGTLQRVEGQVITVQTDGGVEAITLPRTATVRVGSHTLSVSDLKAQTGARVKVRYTESGGQKEAQSVTVSSVKKPRPT